MYYIIKEPKTGREFMKWKIYFKEENRKKFYLTYTILAVLVFGVISLLFLAHDRSMIRMGDALKQHYVSLAYYGQYLRSVIRSILVEHTFELPMWDMHIGFGADIITTLNYYVIGDPVNLLSVFVPLKYTEYLYGFLIFLRMYLAGIAFSRFCFFHGNRQGAVLLGSLVYLTSQWMIFAGVMHPFFLAPCIYLPLLLLGVDKILAGEKPLVYILSVGLAGMSNFYFFYMLGIFTVIYGVFRYFMIYRGIHWKAIRNLLLRFFLYSVLGIMISAVILLPMIMAALGTDRMGADYYVPLLYNKAYYKKLPVTLIGSRLSNYTLMGVAGICALSLAVLFMKRKRYTGLKAGAVLFGGMYLFPVLGHIMNGFSYSSNRWSFASVCFLSYVFVKIYPEFFTLKKRQRWLLLVFGILYGGYVALLPQTRSPGNTLAGVTLIVTALCIAGAAYRFPKEKKVLPIVISCSLVFSMAANLCNSFAFSKGDWTRMSGYMNRGESAKAVSGGVYEQLRAIPDIQNYRYGQNTPSTVYNAAMINGQNGGQYYFSIAPQGVNDFFQEHGVISPLEQMFDGIDNRSWLMKLFSMKYFVGRDGQVPYGFAPMELEQVTENGVRLYADANPLPFAYTYDQAISKEDFDALSIYERQEAILQGALLSDSSLPSCEPSFTSREIPFTVCEEDGVSIGKKGIRVKKKGASCILEFQSLPKSELYVVFENFQYHSGRKNRNRIFDQPIVTETEVKAEVPADGSANRETLSLRTEKNKFPTNRSDYLFHLAYHAEPVTRVKLTFGQRGRYTFDRFQVVCQKMDTLNQWTNERREDEIKNLFADGNRVSLEITLKEPKALVLSVPYRDGWTMMVDGKPGELKKANGLFLGTELEAGTHKVELHYTTPYIRIGACLTLIGLAGTIGILFRKKKETKNQ